MKRIVSLMMAILMTLMMSLAVMAEEATNDTDVTPVNTSLEVTAAEEEEDNNSELTLDAKADVMNQIDILRGDGINFNLEGQLKRSEAAAFIVRLIGMDTEVTENKGKYLQMDFVDVESHQWYAPYVGYCSQVGIISGFEDGTFRPDEFVSEQAFLKMILTAIGYEYNVDFVWSTVFASAYNLKVVSDASYLTRTEDNTSYTRGEVVEALFNSLRNKKKGTETYMLQYFVDEALITEEEAGDYGIVAYDKKTAIAEHELLNNHLIQVTFNEPIEGLDLTNVKATNVSDAIEVTVLRVQPAEYGDSWLVSLKDDMLPDRTYDIEFSNVEDSKGNVTEEITLSIDVERTGEVTSNYFIVSKIEAADENTVNVYFTHPVNDNALVPAAYSIKQGSQLIRGGNDTDLSIGLLPGVNNAVAVTLKDYTLASGVEYTVNVTGDVISQYGVFLNDGAGDYAKVIGLVTEPVVFGVASVKSDSTKTIELDFTKPVNESMASQVYNYYITNSTGASIIVDKAEVVEGGKKVRLTTDASLTDGKTYSVTVVNIADASGVEAVVGEAFDVTVDVASHSDIMVTSVVPTDNRTLEVTFDTALDAESAVKANYYQVKIVGSYSYQATPESVYYDSVNAPKTVKLYLASNKSMSLDTDYELTVNLSMKDVTGSTQSTWIKKTFTNTKNTFDKVKISEAVVVGTDTIKLTFNKEIALDVPNVLNTNYTLSYVESESTVTKTPISANYIDAYTVIVKFVGLDKTKLYTMTFDSLVDYAGNVTDNGSGVYSERVEW